VWVLRRGGEGGGQGGRAWLAAFGNHEHNSYGNSFHEETAYRLSCSTNMGGTISYGSFTFRFGVFQPLGKRPFRNAIRLTPALAKPEQWKSRHPTERPIRHNTLVNVGCGE